MCLCINCAEDADCPIVSDIEDWYYICKGHEQYGMSITDEDYDIYYIDKPTCINLEIVWCPLYYEDTK